MTPNQKTELLRTVENGCPIPAAAAVVDLTMSELDAERASDHSLDRAIEIAQLKAVAELQAVVYAAATVPTDRENRVEWRAALEILKTLPGWQKAQPSQQRKVLDEMSFALAMGDE